MNARKPRYLEQFDKLDRQLLYRLDQNSRASYVELAEQCGSSAERVRYRIARLLEEEVINKFKTIVDSARFGFTLYKIWVKLVGADEKQVVDIIDYLEAASTVSWVVRCDGPYDLAVAVKVTHISDLSDFVDNFVDRYNRYISERRIAVNMYSRYLSRPYLVGKKSRSEDVGHYAASGEQYPADDLDRLILVQLSRSSRISAAEILEGIQTESNSPTAVTSRETVLRRIRRLEENRVITGYNLVLNHRQIGQLHYKLMLYLNNISGAGTAELLETCSNHPRIVYIIKTLGEWDYELDLEVGSVEEYREIIALLTGTHKVIIKDYFTVMITGIHKYILSPLN